MIVLVPRSPLIFVHQFVHADYNSQKWKSGTVYYIKLKIKNGGGLGKKMGNVNKYFSNIYYYCFLLSHCSFLKSIDHNVLNAVTWHQ